MEAETEGRKRREERGRLEGGGDRVTESGRKGKSSRREKGKASAEEKAKEVPCGRAAEEAAELWSETE